MQDLSLNQHRSQREKHPIQKKMSGKTKRKLADKNRKAQEMRDRMQRKEMKTQPVLPIRRLDDRASSTGPAGSLGSSSCVRGEWYSAPFMRPPPLLTPAIRAIAFRVSRSVGPRCSRPLAGRVAHV